MSDRTNDRADGRSNDDEWVALLLAATESPRMPDDVADRLERALRAEATDPVADSSAPAAPGAVTGPGVDLPRSDPDHSGSSADPAADPADGFATDPAAHSADDEGARSSGPSEDPDAPAPLAADPDGDGPLPSVLGGASRPWGSSRRERREEDQGERRRRALARWAPVAASVLVLGAAGVTAVAVLGQGDDAATDDRLEAASAVEEAPPAPRALVSTGTEYTTTDPEVFESQVLALVDVAGSGTDAAAGSESAGGAAADSGGDAAGSEVAADDAAGEAAEPSGAPVEELAAPEASTLVAPEAARAAAADSPLSERTAFDECVDEVTDGSASTVAAMDLAVVDGLQSTVLVVPDAAGESYLVYVVGPDCTGIDSSFDFFTVEP